MATAVRPSASLREEAQEEEVASLLSDNSSTAVMTSSNTREAMGETQRGYPVRAASGVKYAADDQEGGGLFAGLSFPEPPTHRPMERGPLTPAGPAATAVSSVGTNSNMTASTRTVPFDASKVAAVAQPPAVRVTPPMRDAAQALVMESRDASIGSWRGPVVSETAAPPQYASELAASNTATSSMHQPPTQQEHIATPAKLTSLYSTESAHTAAGSAFYPSLPDAPSLVAYVPNAERSQSSSSSQQPVDATQSGSDPALVHELLDENTRLRRELDSMRRGEAPTGLRAPAPVLQQQPVTTNLSAQARTNTVSVPMQPPAQQQQQLSVPQQPQQQSAVGQNPPASQHTKYVCCGGCRQWLAAPRDANLVYCAQCQCVNDCSMSPEAARNYNIVQANRYDNTPWYVSCFKEFFS